MSNGDILIGWRAIYDEFYAPYKSWSTFKVSVAPALLDAGVVGHEIIGRPPNRIRAIVGLRSAIRAYIVVKNQKARAARKKKKR